MDRDDKSRYFIVGSVFYEIVAPLFRRRIEKKYTDKGFGSVQEFINSEPVIHILFHRRYRNVWCCTDKKNCIQHLSLPLHYNDWGRLFTLNPQPKCGRHCHCKFMSNPVQLHDLDITLAGLILKECCSLDADEETAIDVLRKFKNNYLSHNTDGYICLDEFNTLWADLTTHVLKLDETKEDYLIRIQNRPLDEKLCKKYHTELLAIHKKLDEMDAKLDVSIAKLDISDAKLDVILKSVRCKYCQNGLTVTGEKVREPYTLGQDIFYLYHQFNIKNIISAAVITDDGKIVLCSFSISQLMICNTDGSELGSIPLQNQPWDVTAVNNSTVAVTLPGIKCVQVCDINNQQILSTIPVPGACCGITKINNQLAVGGRHKIWIINHVTGQVVKTMDTEDVDHLRLHAYKERLFSCNPEKKTLICYTYSGNKVFTKKLPYNPTGITSLKDGSLYMSCFNGSVLHISADGKHCKPVAGLQLQNTRYGLINSINYNIQQMKLIYINDNEGHVNVFCETEGNM